MSSIDFPKEEEKVLNRWREIKAFERQIELSKGRKPYTFYDGPPFGKYCGSSVVSRAVKY
jgi:isoleucyl-tRNA synthetase